MTPGDQEAADILRRREAGPRGREQGRRSEARPGGAVEFHALGLGEPLPISALHGHGTGDLLDRIVDELEAMGGGPRDEIGDEAIRVAILGRPNVGKSSLLNAIGEDRVIVSEVPGTTRDAIDTVVRRGDTTFDFVDTAGLRRKRRQRQGIEYYSELRAIQAAGRADVALVLVDASTGLVDQDLAVADVARTAGDSTLVVLSKWDIAEIGVGGRPPAPRDPAAAAPVARRGVGEDGPRRPAPPRPDRGALRAHTSRVGTGELNRFLQELRAQRPGPQRNGRRLNLLYGTQVSTRPPRFKIFVNDPGLLTRDYGYWVENRLRERFGLAGVPVVIDFARRS